MWFRENFFSKIKLKSNYMVFKRAILKFYMVSTHVHVRHSKMKKDKRIRKVSDSFRKPNKPQNQKVV